MWCSKNEKAISQLKHQGIVRTLQPGRTCVSWWLAPKSIRSTIDVFRSGGGLEIHSSRLATAREVDHLGWHVKDTPSSSQLSDLQHPSSPENLHLQHILSSWMILQTLDEILEVSRHEADESSPEPAQRKIHFVMQGGQVLSNTARPWSLKTAGAELNLMKVVHLSVRSIDLVFAVRSSIVHQHDSRRPSTAGWAQLRWRALSWSKYVLI